MKTLPFILIGKSKKGSPDYVYSFKVTKECLPIEKKGEHTPNRRYNYGV